MGEGEPIIVLHGGPGLPSSYLLPQMLALAKNHKVIFYDQRGCGKSTGAINANTMQIDKAIEDLAAIIRHFQLEKVSLVGHSWGALLALFYAITYPAQMNKLILLNPIPVFAEKKQPTAPETDMYVLMIKKIIESKAYLEIDGAKIIGYYKETFKYFFNDPEKLNVLNLAMSDQAAVNSALIHFLFEQTLFANYDIRDKLRELDIDTLIVYGRNNDLPPNVALSIQACIQRSSCIELESGHFPFIESPELLFKHMNEFIDKKRVTCTV